MIKKKTNVMSRSRNSTEKSANPLIRALIPIPHSFVILCFTVSKTALTSAENILHYNSIS